MTDQLKPCPFCGNHLYVEGAGYEHPYSDTCPLDSLYIEKRLVAAWNTRAPGDASPAADPAVNADSRQRVKVKPLVWESVGKGWVASDDLFNVTRYAESTESRDAEDNAREARILAALEDTQ